MPPAHAALALWGGWALTAGAVLSGAGGIFHTYYLAPLAPPLAALAGIGAAALWARYRAPGAGWLWLPAALLATAAWQAWLEAGALGWTIDAAQGLAAALLEVLGDRLGDWPVALYLGLIVGVAVAVGGLVAARRAPAAAGAGALALGLAALLATPTAWSLSTVLARGDVWFPAADLALIAPGAAVAPPRARGIGSHEDVAHLIAFLEANRAGERFVLATLTAVQAAPIIVRSGHPVMAIGGFNGNDPIVTPEDLARLIDDGHLRFVMVGTPTRRRVRREPAPPRPRAIVQWVRTNGQPVEPALWRGPHDADAEVRLELFDLKPAAGALRAGRPG
jgi:4-amino-4-deoxy-L-arabinose transferase-like glycosyltransferase